MSGTRHACRRPRGVHASTRPVFRPEARRRAEKRPENGPISPPGQAKASPVRAGKSARTGAVNQAEVCCFGGFNSRPHRTNNLHDLLFWRIRNRGVRVACSKAAWCSRGVREALSWRAQRPRGDVVAFSQAEWRSRGVLTGRAATTETTFLGDSCVRGFNDCPRFPGL